MASHANLTNKALDFIRAARSPVYKSTFYTSMTVNISKSKATLMSMEDRG